MRHPVNRELFAYWDTLRAGRAAPERSAIDPAAIRNLLAHTFLLELGQPDERGARAVSFRLSGTRLNALFRRDLKGSGFGAIFAEGEGAGGLDLVAGVLDDGQAAVAGLRAAPRDYAPTDFELLLLPLRHHGRTHARLLGAIVAETVPTWIGLRPIEGFRLGAFRTILPSERGRLGGFAPVASAVDAVAPAPARTQVPFAPWGWPRQDGVGSPAPSCTSSERGDAESRGATRATILPRPFQVLQGGRASGRSARSAGVADLG